jgi:predicted DNA-binding protein with PD1-like motif
MKSKLISENPKTFAVVFQEGDEAIEGLKQFALKENLSASQVTGIGALNNVLLGHYNVEKKDYKRIPINEQVEVVSLLGDITLENDEPRIHAHAVVTKSDGTAHGGHLLEAYVRPTLELIVTESPKHLRRVYDPVSGLGLIDLDQTF